MTNLADQIPAAQTQSIARPNWKVAAILALIVLLMLLRPGDASFVADEPRLIAQAMALNHKPGDFLGIRLPFSLAHVGLEGSLKIRYGPLPIWIYQCLVLITHDLPTLVAIRAGIVGGLTAIALIWLTRVMRVNPWLAVVVMLSPWLWYFSRQLWDNSFCIPLCAFAFAAYADFLATRCGRSMAVSLLCCIAAMLVHLMTFALFIPLLLHALIFKRSEIFKFKWRLLAIIIAMAILAWPYAHYLFTDYHPTIEAGLSPWYGFLFPLLGAHHLSAFGLGSFLGKDWLSGFTDPLPAAIFFAQIATCAAYVVVWVGMFLAGPRAWRIIKDPKSADTIDHLSAMALATFLCQCLIDGLQRAYGWDHYFNSTWIVYVFFAWLAIDALQRHLGPTSRRVPIMLGVYAAALLVVLSAAGYKIARDHGGASHSPYGSSLAEQIDAVRIICGYVHAARDDVQIPQWKTFPWALKFLCQQQSEIAATQPAHELLIQYRNGYPGDARIDVEVKTP